MGSLANPYDVLRYGSGRRFAHFGTEQDETGFVGLTLSSPEAQETNLDQVRSFGTCRNIAIDFFADDGG